MTFRPQNEHQTLAGCVLLCFGLAMILGALLITGPETTILGRALALGFGVVIGVAALQGFRSYWIADQLTTTPDHLVVWSKNQQFKIGWNEIESLIEDSGPESVCYFLKVYDRRLVLLGEGEEARWFLYECARLSRVTVTRKGKPKE